MKDPKRLIEGDPLAASLLSSARADGPSQQSRGRAVAALGLAVGTSVALGGSTAAAGGATASVAPKAIGAGVAAAGAAAGGAGGSGTTGAGAAGVIGAKALAGGVWLKLVAGGLVTAAVVGGVATGREAVRRSERPTTTIPSASASPPASTNGRATPAADAPNAPAIEGAAAKEDEMSPAATEVAAAPPALVRHGEAAKSAPARARPPGESPLARELASLDLARRALASGDAQGALAELDRHDRLFSSGSLRTEAMVLRVEALLARGDKAAAGRLARDLLARDPSGPHAKRLRTIAEAPP